MAGTDKRSPNFSRYTSTFIGQDKGSGEPALESCAVGPIPQRMGPQRDHFAMYPQMAGQLPLIELAEAIALMAVACGGAGRERLPEFRERSPPSAQKRENRCGGKVARI
jgi:hypothetical protein